MAYFIISTRSKDVKIELDFKIDAEKDEIRVAGAVDFLKVSGTIDPRHVKALAEELGAVCFEAHEKEIGVARKCDPKGPCDCFCYGLMKQAVQTLTKEEKKEWVSSWES